MKTQEFVELTAEIRDKLDECSKDSIISSLLNQLNAHKPREADDAARSIRRRLADPGQCKKLVFQMNKEENKAEQTRKNYF